MLSGQQFLSTPCSNSLLGQSLGLLFPPSPLSCIVSSQSLSLIKVSVCSLLGLYKLCPAAEWTGVGEGDSSMGRRGRLQSQGPERKPFEACWGNNSEKLNWLQYQWYLFYPDLIWPSWQEHTHSIFFSQKVRCSAQVCWVSRFRGWRALNTSKMAISFLPAFTCSSSPISPKPTALQSFWSPLNDAKST